MSFIIEGLQKAFALILSLDKEVFQIVLFSLRVSSIAILFSSLIGVPLGFVIGSKNFWGKKFIVVLLNNALAIPTVVIGLLVYSLISRVGPLGYFGLLYTPTAVIIGQFLLSLPIIIALTHSAIQGIDIKVRHTALTLGATEMQAAWAIIKEARFAVMSAVIAGFGRNIAEVGAAMMLGGNIKGSTRTMTTAITLETSKGEFGFGIALGILLLLISLIINIILSYFQSKKI
ncbi:MAG: ABC transporter permease [Candidatus Caldatribacteriota bacterium]|nr:ABC transporter permease [Atribacterota bacterium]MDD4289165.1 ABC transporter permease [Atribacterota bacterium]MDD4764838.1 ABC transporter permease [Atribacterota bacterium]MDD5635436.1 ABC transporter permease [Atribacterota bacterium]MDI9596777.1 ABC transporter permease [Atribacterota bacterium]